MYARSDVRAMIAAVVLSTIGAAQAAEYNGTARKDHGVQATDRLIVHWKKQAGSDPAARIQKIASSSGQVGTSHPLDAYTDVIQLSHRLSGTALSAAVEELQDNPDVVYASPDLRRHAHALTNDPLLGAQWYLLDQQPAATRAQQAWDITTGRASVIVAVLDTGVRFEHPDLGQAATGGKLLPGFDFVSSVAVANDGNVRDPDPSDPGDWVNETDRTQPSFGDCDLGNSSWHGTRVAGMIGAMTDNLTGVAGGGFNVRILPVRVLGKCGGFDSDIIAAMRWAAGLSVAGVPDNPTPANVINLSLGGSGVCTAAYQAAIDEVTGRGTLVVASAGNDGGPVSAPANCSGVLGVSGIRHVGTKTGLSNLGGEIGVSAPSGNCVNTAPGAPCLFTIVTTKNDGATAPTTSSYVQPGEQNVGTSFSAPQVAAAAALMRSINARLSPANVTALLRQSAAPFPVSNDPAIPTCHVPTSADDLQTSECNCTTQTCGAGMLDTAAAVAAAQQPFAILQTTGAVAVNATVALDGSASFASDGRTLTDFSWSVADVVGSTPVIVSPAQSATTLQIGDATQFTLRLTVTDDQGAQDTAELSMAPSPAPPTPTPPSSPPGAGGGGGGGGAGSAWEILWLTALVRGLRRNRPARRHS